MRILLFGSDGQVGWELRRSLSILGEVLPLTRKSGDGGDLSNLESLRRSIQHHCPDVIVNAAAYTDVAGAERKRDFAFAVNALAPEAMAQEAARCGALLVHYSTDYVYDGKSLSSYTEEMATFPLNVYGESKLGGDRRVMSSGCDYLVFRTSWVYSIRGSNFLTTMARLLCQRDQLKVVSDEHGAPTSAELIADVTAHSVSKALHNRNLCGLYHLTAKGRASWYDYALFIAGLLRARSMEGTVDNSGIMPVTAEEYGSGVIRPRNSCLSTARLEQTFNLEMPDWTAGVTRVVDEWLYFEKRRRA